MRKMFEIGGVVAAAVLIAFGIATIVLAERGEECCVLEGVEARAFSLVPRSPNTSSRCAATWTKRRGYMRRSPAVAPGSRMVAAPSSKGKQVINSERASALPVGALMKTDFVSFEPWDTLGETAEKMAQLDVGSALVLDSGRLVGILTCRDLMRAIAGRTHWSEARVRDWMTPDPRVARPETAAEEATLMMVEQGCHHLPVVDEGRPVGVVGMRSVVSETFEPVLV